MIYDAIIVGGGVSGLVSAISIARKGLTVAILEKNDRLGKKILATGNGKCNIMPSEVSFSAYNSCAVEKTFEVCTYADVLDFWKSIGIVIKCVDNRCYPYSMQASSVQNALRKQVEDLNITVHCNTEVTSIDKNEIYFVNYGAFKAKNIVFCTGSNATFGTDSLYILDKMGIKTIGFVPSLVPILTDTQYIRGLKGVRAECGVTLRVDGVAVASCVDEVIFKDNGVSGSAIFELSATLARKRRGHAEFVFNFMPDKNAQEIINTLTALSKAGHSIETLFHKEICNNLKKRLQQAGDNHIAELALLIMEYNVDIKGIGSNTLAQVMSGGVSLKELDLSSMQSGKYEGLYVAGEVVNVDGVCGGHNLLWATASALAIGEKI
ncbi:MAG: aminoacetone oxidase family FAD-binding enzyme [Bacillota bacterium]